MTTEGKRQGPDTGYTLVIIPEGGDGRVQRIPLSRRALRRWLWAGGVLAALFFLSAGYSLYNLATLPERWRLEEQLFAQRLHLARLEEKLHVAQDTLSRLERLDRKLRIVLGAPLPEREGAVGGVGGPTELDVEPGPAGLDTESRFVVAKLELGLEEVQRRSSQQELRLQELNALFNDQTARLASTPSIWPTRGWVTSTFGMRVSPFTGVRKMHEGVDIATRLGNPVRATADGVVLFAGVKSGYGKVIVLDHGYGITTRYGHLSRIEVEAGQRVHRGDVIGRVGNTGRSTGPHLHYEVRLDGAPVDPFRFILLDDEQLP